MGLDALAAAESRIAQIRAMFTTGSGGTLGSVGPSNSLATAALSAGAGSSSSSFNDVLSQVSGGTSGVGGTASGATASGSTTGGSGRAGQYEQFAQDVLKGVGAPVTSENVRALKAWALAEGTRAANNPLATTRTHSDTTNFNSVGVKNYSSYADGLQATIETLQNGRYPNILAAFANGNDAMSVAHAVAASPWGTGHGVERVLTNGGV